VTVTTESFRASFPEFADTGTYPDAVVSFWLAFVLRMLPADRWGDVLDHGVSLMLAHQVTLAAGSARGKPGSIAAPQSAKTVDKVSVSYDTSAVRLDNAGHWAGTSYGLQFLQLARMIGAGGMQL
jgi:hypothetical protein